MYSYKISHLWYTLYMPYFVVFAHQITRKMQRSHTHVAFVRQECHDLAYKPPPQFLANAIMQGGGGGGIIAGFYSVCTKGIVTMTKLIVNLVLS